MPRWLVWPLLALVTAFVLGEEKADEGSRPVAPSSMIALLNEHGLAVSVTFCAVSMVSLGILVVLIWMGCLRRKISYNQFFGFRKFLAVAIPSYAAYCAWRLTENVALPRTLDDKFVPELIAISIFWVLAPPIWFFVEYFAVASHCIKRFRGTEENLQTIKNYADYASKIWAGVLALLLALIALKK
jgi:hypothetical protein